MVTVKVHKANSGKHVYINREYADKAMQELSGEALKMWMYLYVKSANGEMETIAPNDVMEVCNLNPEEFNNAFEEMKSLGYICIEDGLYVFHEHN